LVTPKKPLDRSSFSIIFPIKIVINWVSSP
jgi:hypothetical protein